MDSCDRILILLLSVPQGENQRGRLSCSLLVYGKEKTRFYHGSSLSTVGTRIISLSHHNSTSANYGTLTSDNEFFFFFSLIVNCKF